MSKKKKDDFKKAMLIVIKTLYPNIVLLDIHKFLIDSALEEFYNNYLIDNQLDVRVLMHTFLTNYRTTLDHASSIIPNDGQPFTITIEDNKFSIPSLEDYAIFDDLGRDITDYPFP